MSWRSVSFGKKAVLLAAAFLLMASQAQAGDRVRAANQPNNYYHSQTTTTPVTRTVSLLVTVSAVTTSSSQPLTEPAYVDLRGPNGEVRRFPVEGGRATIQYRQTFLRPGEMLTIHWAPAK
jgi:hypothetical protein